MTKLFKKSLALLLTLALCLSAMACCFLVSAEGESTPVGSISFVLNDEGDINPGDDVTIDVVANWTGVAGAEFTVTGIPAEATVATTNTEVVINHDAAAGTVKFVDGNNGELSDEAPLFSISFTAGAKDTTYTFEIDEDTAVFCNLAEEDVTVTSEATSFTVVEKVVEPEVPVEPAEPEVDNTLALGRTILARDKMGIRFMTVKAQLAAYDSYYLEVETQHFVSSDTAAYALTTTTDVFEYADAAAEDNNYVYFDYTGITAFEMTLPIKATIYCVKDDVVVKKSQTWDFTLAYRILTSAMTNSDKDAVFVDMVNYGAAVQSYFAAQNPTSDLAKHTALPNEGFDAYQKYATSDEIATAAMAKNINSGVPATGYNAAVGKGLQVAATNQIYFLVATSNYDVNNMKLVVEYVNSYNEDKTATVPVTELVKAGNYYYYYADGDKNVALFDTSVPVTAKLYLGEDVIYTRTYSVESFVAESMQSGDLKPLGDTLMKFSYSIRVALNLD